MESISHLKKSLLIYFSGIFCLAGVHAQCPNPPTVDPVQDVNLCSGQNLNVTFSGTPGASFFWTNSNPAIGIPAGGVGSINANVVTVLSTQVATFTVTPVQGACSGTPVSFTVTVTPGISPTLPNYGTICRNTPPFALPTSPGGINGNWSGIGVVNNVFNPAASTGDPVQLLFVPNPGQCAVPASITITFYPEIFFWFTAPPGPFCEASGIVPISGILQPPGTPAVWSGPGIVGGNTFDPALAGPGTHPVTVTVVGPCPVQVVFQVEVQPAAAPIFNPLGPYCVGSTPAALPGVSQNGIAGTWSPSIINTSTPGTFTYTFTPADGQGCVGSTQIQVQITSPPVLTCQQLNPTSAPGASDGAATVEITGGVSPYDIAWSGPVSGTQTQSTPGTATISGLQAGTYSVTVTDAQGCVQTCTFSIGDPACNIALTLNETHPTCAGASNGSIGVAVANASGMPSFAWSNPLASGQNPTGLPAGTYVVTVTDGAGCSAVGSATLNTPPAITLQCNAQTPATTVGGNQGSATVQIAGGTPSYTIAWSGAASGSQNQAAAGTATLSGLLAGSYTVTVTDANGCTQTCSFVIAGPNCNIVLNLTGNNPLCHNNTNGSINLVVINATGGVSYDWNVNALDGIQNPTGLGGGFYAVTVTDAIGCTQSAAIGLLNPAPLTLACSQQSPVTSPGGNNGVGLVQISGGTAGYTILWVGPTNGTLNRPSAGPASVPGLSSGTYQITVTDANGCQQTCNFTITQPTCGLSVTLTGTDILCNGQSTGSIQTTVTGGNGPLTFDWNINALDGIQNPMNLPAGLYSVTITDTLGCSSNASITLNQPSTAPLLCGQSSPVSTIGGNDGAAQVQVLAGTPGYTINWSGPVNGSTTLAAPGTASLTGLSEGNYTVVVTDANGCTRTCGFNIQGPNCNITASLAGVNPSCHDSTNGSITSTVNNASGIVTYDWNVDTLDGQANPSGLGAGVYIVTITDALGCSSVATATLTAPSALGTVCAQTSPVSTLGGTNGSASVQVSGGTPGYTVAWSGPVNGTQNLSSAGTANISNLSAGIYNVTLTDANGCSATCNFTIEEPVCALSVSLAGTNPRCTGGSDGSIVLNFSNALGIVTFDWNVNALDGTQNPTNLPAGTYSVTVTDVTGCTAQASVALNNPPALMATCQQVSPVSTVGGSNGIASIFVEGGTPNYTVAWGGPSGGDSVLVASDTLFLNNLAAGDYLAIITDTLGCTTFCGFTIEAPICNLTVDIAGANLNCHNDNSGSIALTVTGANGSVAYDWNVNALDGQSDPTGLSAGSYIVTVTDMVGCTAQASVVLTEPAPLTLACSQQNPASTIGGNDGAAAVQISGGTAPYNVAWSGPVNGSGTLAAAGNFVANGLSAGDYTITVTDANGCSATCTVTIEEPFNCQLGLNISGTDLACHGVPTGAITLLVNNPAGSVSFDWNVDLLDGTQNPTNLAAGTYSVTATDAQGCTANATVTLTEPDALMLACAQQQPATTVSGADGIAIITTSGGTPAITLSWTGPSNGTQTQAMPGVAVINNLPAGTYTLTATDANGCTQICTFIIDGPSCNISLFSSAVNPQCAGNSDGSISLILLNVTGTPAFDWNVNTLDGIQNPAGLGAGTYTVTVTDEVGCTASTTVVLSDPAAPTAVAVGTAPLCFGGTDGSIALTLGGFVGPLTFDWNVDSLDGVQNPSNLAAGAYSVIVTDSLGCSAADTISLNDPAALTLVCTQLNPASSGGASNGVGRVQVSGGTAGYTVAWSGPASGTQTLPAAGNADLSGLAAGVYSITVSDANNCSDTCSFVIQAIDCALALTATGTAPTCAGQSTGSIALGLTGAIGPVTIDWNVDSLDGVQNPSNLAAGAYSVIVTDSLGCSATASATLSDPAAPTVAAVGTAPLCFGGTDGSIALTLGGFVGPLTFDWNVDSLDGVQNPSNLAAGAYSVIVTDSLGCSAADTITLNDPAAPTVAAVGTAPLCFGGTDGSIALTLGGFVGPLTFDWNVDSLDGVQNPSNLAAGAYSVIVTDSLGCSAVDTITLNDPAALTLVCTQLNPASSGGASNGVGRVQVSGGTAGYTVAWSGPASGTQPLPAAGNADLSGLAAGVYSITVSDANGCSDTCSFVIQAIDCTLALTATGTAPTCAGQSTGSIALGLTGAIGPVTIDWSVDSLDGVQNPTNLAAGAYSVIVTDSLGCSAADTITLNDPAAPTVAAVGTAPLCFGGTDGSIALTLGGFVGPLTFDWNVDSLDGVQNPTNLTAGAYSVIVTDSLGCSAADTITLNDPTAPTVAAVGTAPLCFGGTDGSIALTLGGFVGPLTFDWNVDSLDGVQNPSNLAAGAYSVIVTDSLGCSAVDTISLNDPAALTLVCTQLNPASSGGASNGVGRVQVSGGTAGYTVAWSGPASGTQTLPAAGNADLSGLAAGVYSITVSDANGCSDTCSFVIQAIDCTLALTATGTAPTCAGQSTGSIALGLTGAIGPVTIDWSVDSLDGVQNPTNLAAGAYSVIVTDSLGCSAADTITLNDPAAPTVAAVGTAPLCFGGTDGSIALTLGGFVGPLTFDWNVDSLDGVQNPTNLTAGAYSVIVTDSLGCSAADTITLNDPTAPTVAAVGTAPLCFGGTDGSIALTLGGFVGPLTFDWNVDSLDGVQNPSNLAAGAYSVIVTDSLGCSAVDTITLNDPAALTLVCTQLNPASSGGASNGVGRVQVSGGTAGYTVAWSGPASGTQPLPAAGNADLSGLAAGVYSITVSDANGCSDTCSFVIQTIDCTLALTATGTAPICAGQSTGSIALGLTGAIGPVTIDWSVDSLDGVQNPSNLAAGAYSVIVTDSLGCSAADTITLNDPAAPTVAAVGTAPLCFGGTDGSIALTLGGFVGPLTFDWNVDSLDGVQNPSNLAAGAYSVIVTDSLGCSAVDTISLNDPAALTLVCTQLNPASSGGASNGVGRVQVSGGTAGYTVAWSGPVSGTQTLPAAGNADLSGLAAGVYSITVSDANGCSDTCSFVIQAIDCTLALTATGTAPTCAGQSTGSIALGLTGAIGPVTIDWNVDSLDGMQNPTNLAAGAYSVIVTDSLGCSAADTITLNDPAAPTVAAVGTAPLCFGGTDGSIALTLGGFVGALTFDWNVDSLDGVQNPTNLAAGAYSVIVTDSLGCSATASATLSDPAAPTVAAVGTAPLCFGGTDGSVALTLGGFVGPLTFDWSVDSLDGVQNPSNLAAGVYSVIVTDSLGCSAADTITLNDPAALTLVCTQQSPVTTVGGNNGSASIQIAGGTAAYTITWSGAASGSQTAPNAGTVILGGLVAGNYNVTVSDANGCSQTCTFSIAGPSCNLTLVLTGSNPTCNGGVNGSITSMVTNATGTVSYDWNINTLDGIANPMGLAAGVYSLTVADAAGCTATATVILSNPPALTLVCAQQSPVTTVGGNNGSASIQIAGGTAAYTITWSGAASGSQTAPNAGTVILGGLVAGNYDVTVSDANGCSQTCTFSIAGPSCNILLSSVNTNPRCHAENSGAISLTVFNASGVLQFDWNVDTLDGRQNPTGLAAGNYSVTVTDNVGCQANLSVTLTAPPALVLNCAQQNPVSTVGGNDGAANVQISGGTAPYLLSWSGPSSGSLAVPVAQTRTLTGLRAGNYSLTLTDGNGCSQTCTFTVEEPVCTLRLSVSGTNPVCNGASSGNISTTVSGATGAVLYDWNINTLDGIANPTGLRAGVYELTITDAIGCQDSARITLIDPPALAFTADGQGADCFNAPLGSITIQSIANATPPYEVFIGSTSMGSFTQAPHLAGRYSQGSYTVRVRDANGCQAEAGVTVPAPLVYRLDLGPDLTILLGDTVSLEGVASFPIATARWTPAMFLGDSTRAQTPAWPRNTTTYRLTAFDSVGCKAEDIILVQVDKTPRVFVPNAFSPNGDNQNDRLTVFASNGVAMVRSLRIFDRWGNLLYFGGPYPPNDPQFGWDGTFNGREMDPSVYVFAAELEFVDGRVEVWKGDVLLLR